MCDVTGMQIYSSHTGTLRALVAGYGAAVAKDSRFWGLLTDACTFMSETTQKDMFLLCSVYAPDTWLL